LVSQLQKQFDIDEIFAIPVVEAAPEVAHLYNQTIDEPMDFRTILEDRVGSYNSIDELRHDLVLIFTNCIRFNAPESDLGILAWYVCALSLPIISIPGGIEFF
jgi:hypothetical protein